ncbi:uncharacterized protein BX663DRAFT_507992 [Cokeromyces recurvatus]|uniref:uncharacterized protein n=1 Tax=Cokeromyces recurvatus TaxID=90255 RepID=UPI00221F1581|nr:uncharacterized protein BX663DRAFT_507992 [Cokeromyces recurvatus]KAI7903254.1 hypothetical protein BX663DRAFT_507992 [Cokeromyces recurvatus]
MSDHNALINQFVNMTDVPEDQAQFYLEMSNWDLQLAVSQFFDNNGSEVPAPTNSSGPYVESSISSGASTPTKTKTTSSNSSKIRTLSDLNSLTQNDEADENEHENLYAGGEKSGMVVQGPNKRSGNNSNNNLVDEILKKAAEGGAAPEESIRAPKKPSYYTGTGYRLGSEDEPSTVVEPTVPAGSNFEEEPESVTRHLTFWRNGFSVDDGPLYEYSNPANQEMLTAINSGRAPLSLLNVRHGQPVEVRVVKRQDEDYTPPPKAPPKPFQGAGNRLGSPVAYSAPSPAPGAFPTTTATTTTNSNAAAPTVNESQPTTSIQIRLGDGSKLVAKLNHTHTIGDIRQFIEANHSASRPYILQTTFPVKILSNDNQTVKEAGLLNSVIVQRYQ